MIEKIERLTPKKIMASSMVVIIFLFLIINFGVFIIEHYWKMTGTLETITLTPDEFELYAMEKKNGSYVSVTEDSQLILNKEMTVKNVVLDIEYQIEPGEVTMYYAVSGVGAFSDSNRIWFDLEESGVYKAEFFLGEKVHSLRLDPTIYGGNVMEINSITINVPKVFSDYFAITPDKIYFFVVLTLFSTSFIGLARHIILSMKNS